MRLFVAITLDERSRAQLAYGLEALRRCSEHCRLTRPENLHLTLVFLGEVERSRVNDVIAALRQIRCRPFRMECERAGVFHRQDGDVCWIGVRQSEHLIKLHVAVGQALADVGFEMEARPYRPHLTLGRQVRLNGGALEAVESAIGKVFIGVEKIVLMESKRVAGRLIYEPVETVSLAGGCALE